LSISIQHRRLPNAAIIFKKSVHLYNPSLPGAGADVISHKSLQKIIQQELTKNFGQTFIADNRPELLKANRQ